MYDEIDYGIEYGEEVILTNEIAEEAERAEMLLTSIWELEAEAYENEGWI